MSEEKPIAVRRRRSPEWWAMRNVVQGLDIRRARQKKATIARELAKKEYRLLHPKPKKQKYHTLQLDGATKTWRVQVIPPTAGKRGKWLDTEQSTVRDALKVIDKSGIKKLSMLARIKCLTAETIGILTEKKLATCSKVYQSWHRVMRRDMAIKTMKAYRSSMRKLFKKHTLWRKTVPDITCDQLHDFVNDPTQGASARKIRLAAIKDFYRHAYGFGHVHSNIGSTIRVNLRNLTVEQREAVPVPPVTEEEYRRIVTSPSVPVAWRWATSLGWWLGLRMVDVCFLQWASFHANYIVVYPRKTGRRLIISLADPLLGSTELLRTLEEIKNAREGDDVYCFPDFKEGYFGHFSENVFTQYQAALKSAGVQGRSFHGLRHAFRLRLTAAGKPIKEIAKLMGHTQESTTMAYGRTVTVPPAFPLPPAASSDLPCLEEPEADDSSAAQNLSA